METNLLKTFSYYLILRDKLRFEFIMRAKPECHKEGREERAIVRFVTLTLFVLAEYTHHIVNPFHARH